MTRWFLSSSVIIWFSTPKKSIKNGRGWGRFLSETSIKTHQWVATIWQPRRRHEFSFQTPGGLTKGTIICPLTLVTKWSRVGTAPLFVRKGWLGIKWQGSSSFFHVAGSWFRNIELQQLPLHLYVPEIVRKWIGKMIT